MQYIEFFFGNFWHWLGGLIYLAVIFSGSLLSINWRKDKEE